MVAGRHARERHPPEGGAAGVAVLSGPPPCHRARRLHVYAGGAARRRRVKAGPVARLRATEHRHGGGEGNSDR